MAKISKGFGEYLAQQRKSLGSASTKTSTIKIQNQNSTPPPRNYEEQEKRIGEIVGLDKDGKVSFVSEKTLNKFYEYLVQNLTLPCEVTGSEDFPWEEYYIIGGGSKQEHNKLRKTKPSYKKYGSRESQQATEPKAQARLATLGCFAACAVGASTRYL